MIELLVIYLIIGALIFGSTSSMAKAKMPFVIMIVILIFWFPIMFLCVYSVIRERITRKNIIRALKKDVWKN